MGPLQTTGEAWKGGLRGRTSPYPFSRSVPPPPGALCGRMLHFDMICCTFKIKVLPHYSCAGKKGTYKYWPLCRPYVGRYIFSYYHLQITTCFYFYIIFNTISRPRVKNHKSYLNGTLGITLVPLALSTYATCCSCKELHSYSIVHSLGW